MADKNSFDSHLPTAEQLFANWRRTVSMVLAGIKPGREPAQESHLRPFYDSINAWENANQQLGLIKPIRFRRLLDDVIEHVTLDIPQHRILMGLTIDKRAYPDVKND